MWVRFFCFSFRVVKEATLRRDRPAAVVARIRMYGGRRALRARVSAMINIGRMQTINLI